MSNSAGNRGGARQSKLAPVRHNNTSTNRQNRNNTDIMRRNKNMIRTAVQNSNTNNNQVLPKSADISNGGTLPPTAGLVGSREIPVTLSFTSGDNQVSRSTPTRLRQHPRSSPSTYSERGGEQQQRLRQISSNSDSELMLSQELASQLRFDGGRYPVLSNGGAQLIDNVYATGEFPDNALGDELATSQYRLSGRQHTPTSLRPVSVTRSNIGQMTPYQFQTPSKEPYMPPQPSKYPYVSSSRVPPTTSWNGTAQQPPRASLVSLNPDVEPAPRRRGEISRTSSSGNMFLNNNSSLVVQPLSVSQKPLYNNPQSRSPSRTAVMDDPSVMMTVHDIRALAAGLPADRSSLPRPNSSFGPAKSNNAKRFGYKKGGGKKKSSATGRNPSTDGNRSGKKKSGKSKIPRRVSRPPKTVTRGGNEMLSGEVIHIAPRQGVIRETPNANLMLDGNTTTLKEIFFYAE